MDQVLTNTMTKTTNKAGPGQRRDAECSFGPIRTCLAVLGLFLFIFLLLNTCTDRTFCRQRRDAETLSVRLYANRATLILSPLFKRLVENAAAYINDGQRSFGENACNMNKRPTEISEDDLLKALNDGLRKAGLNGYTDPVAALEEIKRIAVEVLESYVPGERHSIVAFMVKDLFKSLLIFDVRLSPSPKPFILFYYNKTAGPTLNEEFKKAGRPFKWEYKQRINKLFQQLEGSEFPIVLFNLIVNEYPSTRTVSLSYIDSVKFFELENLRQRFLQPTSFTYMDQARRIGYETITIWVCPPNEGDEYVLYDRDETNSRYVRGINQGIIQWYSTILSAGLTERIINDYEHPTDEKFPDYLQIPYMAEDFWPQQLEEILEAHRKQVEEHNASSRSTPKKRGGKAPKKAGTTASGSGGPLLSIQERVKEVTDNEVTMEARYLVKLEPPNAETDFVNEEEEPDMLCSYMCNRDNFIMDCRGNDYDFFTSRRARFSTVKMCSRMAIEVSNRKCRHCEKSLREGVYYFVCLDAAYYSDCAHLHEHSATLRQFRIPFCVPKLRPSPMFRTILDILERESSWLTTVAKVLYTPEDMQPYDLNIKEQARILNYHHVMLNKRIPGHEERKQAHCRTCATAYFPLQRHMEFCKGRACYVPSCGKDLLFDNAG